eukprot:scaffold217825_cov32-Prasinocladus_malaysianus.AAC.2
MTDYCRTSNKETSRMFKHAYALSICFAPSDSVHLPLPHLSMLCSSQHDSANIMEWNVKGKQGCRLTGSVLDRAPG